MGKITAFLKSLLLAAAVLAATLLGFLGIKKGLKAQPGSQFDWQTSSMKKITKFLKSPIGIIAIIILVAVICAGVFVLIKKLAPPEEPKTAATVNGEEIPYQDYKTRLDAQTYFYTTISPLPKEEAPGLGERIREEMIQEVLLTQLLAEHGITVTDEEIRQRIQEIAVDRLFEGDWVKYEEELKSIYHTTLKEVMRTYRLGILEEKMSQLKTKKRVLAIWVEKTEPQLIAYESMSEEQRMQSEEINREKKEKAEEAFRKIRAGEDFASIAREFSEHVESAQKGGDLGMLVPPAGSLSVFKEDAMSFPMDIGFLEALEELQTGESKLYEGFTGYFILKIAETEMGLLGDQGFDQWYADFRSHADITIP